MPDPVVTPVPPATDAARALQLARNIVFCAIYLVLIAIYLAIVPTLQSLGWSGFSGAAMVAVSEASGRINGQVPGAAELAPALFAGVIVLTAPPLARVAQLVLLLLLTLAIYAAYLHMQVVIDAANPLDPNGINEIMGISGEPARLVKTNLDAFAGNVRTFMAIIFGTLLGLKFIK